MPADGWDMLPKHDAILFGAVGAPDVPDHVTVHGLLLPMRRQVRPVRQPPAGVPVRRRASRPLRDKAPGSIDMLVYRENTEGEYAPVGGRLYHGHAARDRHPDHRVHAPRLRAHHAGRLRGRPQAPQEGHVDHQVERPESTAWCCGTRSFKDVAKEYPDVQARSLLVDAAAMDFVRKPEAFDVVVASNLFGDILTDLSAIVTGSMGLAASANINPERTFPSMFEPVHGSAPDIAGKGIANPLAAILSAGLMLDHLKESRGGRRGAERGGGGAEGERCRTPDLGGKATTTEVGDAVVGRCDCERGVSRPMMTTSCRFRHARPSRSIRASISSPSVSPRSPPRRSLPGSGRPASSA